MVGDRQQAGLPDRHGVADDGDHITGLQGTGLVDEQVHAEPGRVADAGVVDPDRDRWSSAILEDGVPVESTGSG